MSHSKINRWLLVLAMLLFCFQAAAACHAATAEAITLSNEEEKMTKEKTGPADIQASAGNEEKKKPYEVHGRLSVKGTDLVDQSGQVFQLKGVSTHGIAWFPQYVNEEAFSAWKDAGANLVRLAMYTDEDGGYCVGGDKEELESVLDAGVKAAASLGMYVIIDWHVLHDQNPLKYQDQAEDFFARITEKYKDYGNVLYEICNEPNGDTTWADVRQYAKDIIPVIRKNTPDAIIIVGTPTWSQDVDKAAEDPIIDGGNVMYALHFYAGTHKDDLRGKLTAAHDAGLPIFISEFSITDASGDGAIDYESADRWKELILKYDLSCAMWSLSNKAESSALLKPSSAVTGRFTDEDLSETGMWLKKFLSEQE